MELGDFELIYKENRWECKNKKKIEDKLRKIVGANNISSKAIDLLAYTRDATLITLNWTLQGKIAGLPDFITWPDTVEQISNILKLANQEKIPVIPYGEGSGLVGGAIPVFGGIIIDMKKFNKILEINNTNLTVTAQSGINGMNLERYLNSKGYTTGHIPQSLYTTGQFSTKYGKIEDIILGMEVVIPEGKILNFKTIARASTGPQLEKLFVGQEGTLGIITKATLKIWPYPEKRSLISYTFPSIEDSFNTVRKIVRENIFPAVIRIYDQFETSRHFPNIYDATDKVMVIFVCEGNEQLVDLEESITRKISIDNSGIDCGVEPVEHWFETRFRVTETSAITPYKIVFDTIEVASLWENAGDIYHSVLESMNKLHGTIMITAHVSHFYPNGVGMYFSFGGTPFKEQSDLEYYQECWNTVIKAVVDSGGSIGHHHGIGINRAQWMESEWGEAMKLLKEIKKFLDPNNILNPGKIYTETWKGGVI